MNVKALVELHQEYLDTPQSLAGNLGDGYLYRHNLLYRNVRQKGLSCGTTYSVGGNDRWFDYLVFPLVNFDELLASKEIPYVDNYGVLLRLCRKHPSLALPEKFIRDAFRRNYLLHETCHCIAHDFLLKHGKSSSKSAALFNSLLGEAFANSVELISSAMADSTAHIFLYVLNSYVPYIPKANELLQSASDRTGMPVFLKLTFVSFFFNNLLGYEHSKPNVEKIFDLFAPHFNFEPKTGDREIVVDALLRCSRLNPRFRDETSVVYFSTFGLEKNYKNFSAEKVFGDSRLVEKIARMADRLCELVLSD